MADSIHVEDLQEKNNQHALWAICGVLALVLASINFMGTDEEETPAELPELMPQVAASDSSAGSDPQDNGGRLTEWPGISVDQLLSHNPFRLRQTLDETVSGTVEDETAVQVVQKAIEESRTQIDRTKEAKERLTTLSKELQVSMVFRGPGGAAALIGDRVVREGEEIDGLRIVQILEDGIIVQPADLK